MTPLRLRLTTRRLMAAIAVVAILAWAPIAFRSHLRRAHHRQMADYHAVEAHSFWIKAEGIRRQITLVEEDATVGRVDGLFELLRYTVATNSKEFNSARGSVPSDARALIALKWARTAAEEAAFHAHNNRLTAGYFARLSRKEAASTPDYLSSFNLPAGWTEDDLEDYCQMWWGKPPPAPPGVAHSSDPGTVPAPEPKR